MLTEKIRLERFLEMPGVEIRKTPKKHQKTPKNAKNRQVIFKIVIFEPNSENNLVKPENTSYIFAA